MLAVRSALAATALAALLALAPAATAATATSTSTKLFGFNDNAVVFGQLSASADARHAAEAGANSSRVGLEWRYAEPAPGVWDLAKYDAIYKANQSKGIKTTFILMFAPRWAWAEGTVCGTADCRYPPGPEHLDAWRAAVTKLVGRYPDLAALEIWNEPNYSGFWHGGIDPEAYTRLLVEAHAAARAAGSSVPILGGSLANRYVADDETGMGHRNFLTRMYAAGAKGRMDGLAVHPYPQEIDLWVFFKMLSDVRDVRQANGDDVPLWITEVGVTTVPGTATFSLGENDQAVMLRKLYDELNGMDDVRSIWVHTLVDPTNAPPGDPERGYGVLRTDYSPKPAYCMFASVRRSGYRCPRSVPSVKSDPVQDERWQAQHYVQAALDAARAYRARHGTYAGLTSAGLHELDPSLSPTAPDGTTVPGPAVDPARVGVWVWDDALGQQLLLCNSSKADRSYCIQTRWGVSPTYGATEGSIYATAGAITNGVTWWW